MMSVSSLNTKIKSLLEATFMHTLVEGEVASLTYHSSGHLYFSIKDKTSSIKCVMWRSSVARMKFRIEKGMHIVVEGSVSVYTPRGEYQFQTVKIEPYGKGALALAYEQLKEKLKEKGYFSPENKKVLPKHISKLALVTAKDSAALHDMLKIIEQRWPLLEVVIVDTLVQGDQAAGMIARALKYADTLNADIVVVGRGGGSAEDLWSFNEEVVADAIFTMNTPIVSAVGHEVDVLISDFVADLRAPTPSAAIEMILPDAKEILYTLSNLEDSMRHVLQQNLERFSQALKHTEDLLQRSSPLMKLEDTQTVFKRLEEDFLRVIRYKLERDSLLPSDLEKKYKEMLKHLFEKKEQELLFLEQKMSFNNPKNLCRSGWAKTSLEGKTTDLASLEENQKFILEDEFTKIEALVMRKF
ncbi:MAG: exodeoxyribonuclease VII large subunit [Sulfurovum sp.]|nr:exodeoxyribonuclease VII large subunit [Sulfurovum sp.]